MTNHTTKLLFDDREIRKIHFIRDSIMCDLHEVVFSFLRKANKVVPRTVNDELEMTNDEFGEK